MTYLEAALNCDDQHIAEVKKLMKNDLCLLKFYEFANKTYLNINPMSSKRLYQVVFGRCNYLILR